MSLPSKSRVIKLQDSETVSFLELYAGERLLYDASMEEYKHRGLRAAAAKRISDALKISGFGPKEVISKFKNLRNAYCQELKKIADSERPGTGTDEVYMPKVFWFEQMNSFVRPFIQQRTTKSNPELLPTNTREEDFSKEQLLHPNTTDSNESTPTTTQIIADMPRVLKRHVTPQSSPTKDKRKLKASRLMFNRDDVNKLNCKTNRVAQIPKEDIYDCFGKYIGSMLRTIGPPTSITLQEKITSLVTNTMCTTQFPGTDWYQSSSNHSISSDSHSNMSGYSDNYFNM